MDVWSRGVLVGWGLFWEGTVVCDGCTVGVGWVGVGLKGHDGLGTVGVGWVGVQ